MTLFGNLPPPEPKKGREDQQRAGTDDASTLLPSNDKNGAREHSHLSHNNSSSSRSSTIARSWALPEFIPNLRRPHKAAKTAATPSTKTAGLHMAPRSEERKLLSPKHPHTMPQNPEELISKWNAVIEAGEAPLEQAVRSASSVTTARLPQSLAEYLPVSQKVQRQKHRSASGQPNVFDPFEEYSPLAPNDYRTYKEWIAGEKQRRAKGKNAMLQAGAHDAGCYSASCSEDSSSDSSNEEARPKRDPGQPSVRVILTNMADEVDEDLERETMGECSTFGEVVQCVAETAARVDGSDKRELRYERVRVVVEFAELDAAIRAQEALDQRFFDGRHISATFGAVNPDK
ncbi:Splicing factor 45 [Coemansia sp. RSA 2399]|nr:Splicing factor 45 [Coemansia sp. RSA 2399]